MKSAPPEHLEVMTSPRETMRVLPSWIQPMLTWLTGMPLWDEEPLFRWTPAGRMALSLALLGSGVFIGAGLLHARVPLLLTILALPLSWLLTVSGMRDLYVAAEHYCVHNTFTRSALKDRLLAELLSTVLWATPFDVYRRDHLKHHRTARTAVDPDVLFLEQTGFQRGMSRSAFRRYVLRTCLSPLYHARTFAGRIALNFSGPWQRIAMSTIYAIVLVTELVLTHGWKAWLLVWAVPLVLLFQSASLINLHSEHLWDDTATKAHGREAIALVCVGRFCGDAVPVTAGMSRGRALAAWGAWWARVFFVHLPYRLFILVGDQSQHDLHHRRPKSDWANAAFERRDDVLAGSPGWPVGYIDVWGTMLDHLDACVDPWASTKIVRHAGQTATPRKQLPPEAAPQAGRRPEGASKETESSWSSFVAERSSMRRTAS